MYQYADLLHRIHKEGEVSTDRTGVGRRSIFGHQMTFDLRDGFPLLGLRRIPLRLVFEELMWFLSGSTDVSDLQVKGVHFWDQWEDKEDATEGWDLGPIYGRQWRRWGHRGLTLDQICSLVDGLARSPHSRRHIVTAWNPLDVAVQSHYYKAPPPCHILFQCYVSPDGHLDLQLYQRSADVVIGVPFNIASYALLLMLLAHEVGLKPRRFIHSLGDAHIYEYPEHKTAAEEMLVRYGKEVREGTWLHLPTLRFAEDMEGSVLRASFKWDDLHLEGYHPHPAIKDLPVAT